MVVKDKIPSSVVQEMITSMVEKKMMHFTDTKVRTPSGVMKATTKSGLAPDGTLSLVVMAVTTSTRKMVET